MPKIEVMQMRKNFFFLTASILLLSAHLVSAAQPPVISSATAASVTAGQPFTYTIAASNNPTSYGALGLPVGLNLNTSTGKITGSTNVVGTTSIDISATNAAGTGTATLQLTVNPVAPIIISPLSTVGSLGVPFSYTVVATGIESPTISASQLPAGLTLGGNIISGTPLQSGTTFVTVVATNTGGQDSKTLTITITAPPVITSPLVIPATVGVGLTYDITASNTPQTFAVEPPGFTGPLAALSVNPNTGAITGAPTVAGTYSVVLSASNTVNGSVDPCVFNNTVGKATATVLIAVSSTAGSPAITSASSAKGMETIPFVYGITATNSPTSYSIDPLTPLPAGLVLDTVSGVITGAPDLLASPVPTTTIVNVIATNNIGSGQTAVAITIDPAIPVITSSLDPLIAIETKQFSYQTVATTFTNPGITDNTYSVSFNPGIPSGNLTIAPTTGLLSGTPDPTSVPNGDDGNYVATITVSNNRGSSSTNIQLFIVTQVLSSGVPIVITSPLQAVAVEGCPFKYQIVAPGATAYRVGPGSLPPHMVIDGATGVISGTPHVGDNGTYNVILRAGILDANQNFIQATTAVLVLTILATPPTPPNPQLGKANTVVTTGTSNTSFISTRLRGFADLPGSTIIMTSGAASGSQSIIQSFVGLTGQVTVNPAFSAVPATGDSFVILGDFSVGAVIGTNAVYTIYTAPDPNDPTQNQLPLFYLASPVPLGLSLSPSSMLVISTPRGQLSGFASQVGTTNVTVTVINSTGSDTHNVAFTVAPITITSLLAASGTVGVPFPPYAIHASGNPNVFGVDPTTPLPGGLTLDPRTGIISGTPTDVGPAAVVFNVKITASNGFAIGSNTLAITINPKPAGSPDINSILTDTATDNVPYTYTITTVANNATSYSATGLPDGILLDPNTGIISGTTNVVGLYDVTISATNGIGTDAEILKLTVRQAPPVILPPLNASTPLGQFFTYSINTSGSQPQTYTATPLPPGLSLNGNIISGIPTSAGVQPAVTLTASNQASPSATATLTIIVTQAPVFDGPSSVTTTIGDSTFSFTFNATGFPAPDLTVDPLDLPPGIIFTQGAKTATGVSGTFSGTPSAAQTFSVPITVTNAIGTLLPAPIVTINVQTMAFSSPLTLAGVVGTAISPYTITANGNPTTFSATGLPPGLSLNGAIISGTPTVAGTTAVSITASNGAGTVSGTLMVGISTVAGAPAIFSSLLLTGTKGVPISPYAIVGNNTPTSYSAVGLPAGLIVDPLSGLITGTPTVSGSFAVTISASNAIGTGSATLVVAISDVAGGPAITSQLTYSGQELTALVPYQITSINPPFTTFGASNLPAGVTVDTTTGIISGTPTVSGTFNVALSVTNAIGTANAVLVLTISTQTPTIVSSLTANGTVGSQFNYQIVATGLTPMTFTTSSLPTGLTLVADTITGIPTTEGSFTVTMTATNALGSDTKTLTIIIGPAPAVITSPLTASGKVNIAFVYTITASGSAPIHFSASPLPPGLSFSGATISGTPALAGTYTIHLAASNVLGEDDKNLVLTVTEQPDDSDGDGFPDELEIALGTDPFNAASTPFGGAPSGTLKSINIAQVQIHLNFTPKGLTRDTIAITGTLPLGAGATVAGQKLILVVGGIVRTFPQLDAHGAASLAPDKVAVRPNRLNENAKLQIKLGPSNFKPSLTDENLINQTAVKQSRQVRVFIIFNNTVFDSRKLLTWNAKLNKTGIGKATNPKQSNLK